MAGYFFDMIFGAVIVLIVLAILAPLAAKAYAWYIDQLNRKDE